MDNLKLVTSQELINNLTNIVLNFWPNRKNNFFPGALPVSIERNNFYKFKQYKYVLCFKSNGIRFFMLHHNNQTYLIDRNFNFYNIYINFTSYVDTILFDGELLKKKYNGNSTNKESINSFIIHDCISAFNKNLTKEHFDIRYSYVHDILNKYYTPNGSEILLCSKKFYNYNEIDNLVNDMKILDFDIDGLIFIPLTYPIGTSTQFTLFKWKMKENHTFDFKIVEEKYQYEAYVIKNNTHILFASVNKNTPDGQIFMNLLKQNCPDFKSGQIIECVYNETRESFDPLMIRHDKNHANKLLTIDKTLTNIKENITFDEIINFIKSCT